MFQFLPDSLVASSAILAILLVALSSLAETAIGSAEPLLQGPTATNFFEPQLGNSDTLDAASEEIPQVTSASQPSNIQPNTATALAETAIPSVESLEQVSTIADLSRSQSGFTLDAANNEMAQVTSVSQLSDVQPTDWAFQALQSLVERYGCIAGYLDSSYRGNRALTRYEFAAGLNGCLERINELITTGTAALASEEDLVTLQKLQAEFVAELATLRGRVDTLEAQIATLEAQQFSTTTKLTGEVVVSLAQAFIDRTAVSSPGVPTVEPESNTILTNRVWLYFDTSFSGRDRLRTRLQARTTPNLGTATGTNMTRLAYEGNNNNDFDISRLEYLLPFAEGRGQVLFEAFGGEFNDNFDTFNPLLQSSGRGSISRFGRFNPIYRLAGNTGLTLTYKLIDQENTKLNFNIGYLAANANLPNDPNNFNNVGLFDGPFGAMAQIDIQPSKNFKFGLAYIHSQNIDLSGGTGSAFASNPFIGVVGTDSNVTADSFGLQATLQASPKFIMSGWVGYTLADAVSGASE